MKVSIVLLSCVALAAAAPQGGIPQVDIPGAILTAFNEVTRQVQSIQSVLRDLNGQFSRMVASGTRLVAGLQQDQPNIPGIGGANGLVGTVFGSVNEITKQLTSVQRTILDINGQLQRMIETGTRMITGPAFYADNEITPPNIAESTLKVLEDWTKQLQGISGVLRDIQQQFSRTVETGSRMITGKLQAEGSGNSITSLPIEGVQSALNLLTQQFQTLQGVLRDFSSQLSRMVESGSRLVAGLQEDQPSLPSLPSPGDAALAVVGTLTQQFQAVQRVLSDLNSQLNRMVATGTRAIVG